MKKVIFILIVLILFISPIFSITLEEIFKIYGYKVEIYKIDDVLVIDLKTDKDNYKLYEFLIASLKALKFYNKEIKNIENNYKGLAVLVNGKGLLYNKIHLKQAQKIIDVDEKLRFLLKIGEPYGR